MTPIELLAKAYIISVALAAIWVCIVIINQSKS